MTRVMFQPVVTGSFDMFTNQINLTRLIPSPPDTGHQRLFMGNNIAARDDLTRPINTPKQLFEHTLFYGSFSSDT